jgi:predicted metal-binding protein
MKFVKCYACDGRHDINFINILETKEIKYSGTSVKFKCPEDHSEQINNSFVFEVKEPKTA